MYEVMSGSVEYELFSSGSNKMVLQFKIITKKMSDNRKTTSSYVQVLNQLYIKSE